MDYAPTGPFHPSVIIHGGAGNITRENLPAASWTAYRTALLSILRSTHAFLNTGSKSYNDASTTPTALSAALHAVTLLENNPLFNSAIGAVFTRAGTIELEASVMVSRGSRKRCAGVSLLKHVRSPVSFAGDLLQHGEADDGGGAGGHIFVSGVVAEKLARGWGCEMCETKTFWTKKRWEEHRRGLEREKLEQRLYGGEKASNQADEIGEGMIAEEEDPPHFPPSDPSWDGTEYLPQGTVGCVVLDSFGTLAVATSTGGLTNKLPGRIGDTPTPGAGFWAEEWIEEMHTSMLQQATQLGRRVGGNIGGLLPVEALIACLPLWHSHNPIEKEDEDQETDDESQLQGTPPLHPPRYRRHAVAMSGTGNGDSFLRLSAVRTAAALVRFASNPSFSLQQAVTWMAGPRGQLQRSAGAHWGVTGEGEGGIIGIETVGFRSTVVADFNRAMLRAWVDEEGRERCMVFRDEY